MALSILERSLNMYNRDEKIKVQQNMMVYGGGFVQALGRALMHADDRNTVRIINAFPDYWAQYLNIDKYKELDI